MVKKTFPEIIQNASNAPTAIEFSKSREKELQMKNHFISPHSSMIRETVVDWKAKLECRGWKWLVNLITSCAMMSSLPRCHTPFLGSIYLITRWSRVTLSSSAHSSLINNMSPCDGEPPWSWISTRLERKMDSASRNWSTLWSELRLRST